MISLFNGKNRQEFFNSTARLEEFRYNDNHVDGPSVEQSERERDLADEIYYAHVMRYHILGDLLSSVKYAKNPPEKIKWLEKIGHNGVNVKGYPKPLFFSDALRSGYCNNIHRMFEGEALRLKKMREEDEKYIFKKTS